jgi:hypothetical protein
MRAMEDMDGRRMEDRLYYCCVPSGCERIYSEPISADDPGDAVRVICNNDRCNQAQWMHAECFILWEDHVLTYLRSCGRARSWSDKQRLQNLWTKKGYDLVYKVCDCKCGKGHIRKDLDYIPPHADDRRQHKKNKPNKMNVARQQVLVKTHESAEQMKARATANVGGMLHNCFDFTAKNMPRPQLRVRTSSFGSTGSSPPSSAGTPPVTPGAGKKASQFDFFVDAEQAASGNMFLRRMDYRAFNVLPRHQQNPYHIKMEDEGPYGNDEIRCFVLSNLSSNKVTVVRCVCCNVDLPVFDRYPLIDGTFFLSPVRYNTDLQVLSDHRHLYLNAVCMRCLEGSNNIRCQACRKQWSGATLILGTMYTYDIFAPMPCCAFRATCKGCRRPILDPGAFNFYSDYSKLFDCPHCKRRDYHFIKQLSEVFICK